MHLSRRIIPIVGRFQGPEAGGGGQIARQYVLRVGDRGTSGNIELAPAFENELQLLADKDQGLLVMLIINVSRPALLLHSCRYFIECLNAGHKWIPLSEPYLLHLFQTRNNVCLHFSSIEVGWRLVSLSAGGTFAFR